MNQLSSIIKSHQTVCWYPSAGADLNAINYWNKGIGNILEPTLFILTDFSYHFDNHSLNLFDSNLNAFIPNQFEILNHKLNSNLKIDYLSEIRVDIKNNKIHNFIDSNFEKIKEHLPDNQNVNEKIEAHELGFTDYSFFLEFIPSFVKEFPEFCNYRLLKFDNIEIILLNSTNEEFHTYCISNAINIDCLLLHRHLDDFCNDVNFINTLNIKEGIVGPSYTSHPKESLTISDIVWESPFNNPDFKNSVAFIKYQ
jgi:hypothetical protein